MYKYIGLCLCISVSSVLCEYLNLNEGDDCQWEVLKGRCVLETRCMTTLDDDSPKHPICSSRVGQKIICCTDCKLVNNTKDAIFIPPSGLFWKTGEKARDECLQYIRDLPYECNEDGFYAGITRELDEENQCYNYGEWDAESSSSQGRLSRAEHPYKVLLGFSEDLSSNEFKALGAIISNKYILTAARINKYNISKLNLVLLGVNKLLTDDRTTWQKHTVKRFIPHPDYNELYGLYNDIALIETENTITFNKDVLPACLHVEAADDEKAITTTWKDLKSRPLEHYFADKLQIIHFDKFTEEECQPSYTKKILYTTQMCYGSKSNSRDACKGQSGATLVISTQFSPCIYTIIGVTSYGFLCEEPETIPDVFTRVAHFKPWIESVVWA